MLGALLCNLPTTEAHGPDRGFVSSVSWNPDWSKQYGPEARRKRKDNATIKRAVDAFQKAEYVPQELEAAKQIVHSRSLVDELEAYKPDTEQVILFILEAYFVFLSWRRQDDDAIAIALLMMD